MITACIDLFCKGIFWVLVNVLLEYFNRAWCVSEDTYAIHSAMDLIHYDITKINGCYSTGTCVKIICLTSLQIRSISIYGILLFQTDFWKIGNINTENLSKVCFCVTILQMIFIYNTMPWQLVLTGR